NLVPLTIPCLSHDLKFLTTQITKYGGDLYPWFDSRPLWDFWIGIERWHSDRSRDSFLRLDAEYCRAFIEQCRLFHATARDHRLFHATARDHPKNINQALADRSELVAAPSKSGTAATNGREIGAPTELTPPARAVAAAYDLQREGKPISLKAACKRAGVDRANLRKLYPEAARIIAGLAAPDGKPPRAIHDRRTGNIDALDETDD